MERKPLSLVRLACLLAAAAIALSRSAGARADEPLPYAAKKTATNNKPLPPLDCWRCLGPGACPPCGQPGEFLYYGTYPWDDDPVNHFSDCPGGNCGRVGAALSLHWIRWHDRTARLLSPGKPPCVPSHCTEP